MLFHVDGPVSRAYITPIDTQNSNGANNMATFKIEVLLMTGEWTDLHKTAQYVNGKWVSPVYATREEAEAALLETYDMEQYRDCSRIVEIEDEAAPGVFQVGKTYSTRSICNHDCIIEITVIKRTAKTIVADCGSFRGEKRLRIAEYEGVETVKPWGSYSMAPTISAK